MAQRAADLPVGGRRRLRAGPQRQPDQHRRARRNARHAPGDARRAPLRPRLDHRLRSRRGAGRGRVHDGAALRRPRPRARARARAPASAGRFLVRAHGRGAPHRRARRARVLAARPRSRRGRLGARERDGRARHRRRALRTRSRAGRDDRHRRERRPRAPLRVTRSEALPVRVRVLRATRHVALRAQCPCRASTYGRGARAPGSRRRGHGDADPGVGHPGRAGLRAASPASRTATAW